MSDDEAEPEQPERADEWSSDDWRPEAKPRRERLRYEPRHAPEPETEET
jgi:hypothetical protein